MFNRNRLVVMAVILGLVSNFAFAELSSKAKKAEKLIESGKVTEALEIYKELMSKDPQKNADLVKEGKDGMANCLLIGVKASYNQKKYEEAKAGAENIISTYKDTPSINETAKYLVMSQIELARDLIDDKKYDECIAQLKSTKEKIPAGSMQLLSDINGMLSKMSSDLLKIAQDSIKQEKCEDAMRNLNSALASSVDKEGSASCKYLMGVCFKLTKQIDKAIASYQEVISSYTGTTSVAPAYADLYIINIMLGNKEDALTDIKQAVSLAPANSDYLFKETELLYELNKTDDAQKIAKKLIPILQSEIEKTYMNKERMQYKLGQSKLILGNYTEAVVEFEKALTRNPNMLDAKKSLASAKFNDKNYSGAVTTYDDLIKQVSTDFDEANDKALKNKDSVELAKTVEDLRRDIAFFHFQKGLCYEQLADYDKAVSECTLGFEGVSTQEAATALKRIQAAAHTAPQEKTEPEPKPIKLDKPVESEPQEKTESAPAPKP